MQKMNHMTTIQVYNDKRMTEGNFIWNARDLHRVN